MSTTHCSEPSCSIERSVPSTRAVLGFQEQSRGAPRGRRRSREAIELFLDVRNFARAADCIHQMAPELFVQGRAATIQAWLGRLPDEFVEQNGWSLYWKASCRMGHAPAESLLLLQRSFEHLRIAGDVPGVYMSWAGIVAAAVYSGNDFYCLEKWLDVFDRLHEEIGPAPSPFVDFIVTTARLQALFSIDPSREGSLACAAHALELSRQFADGGSGLATQALYVNFHVWFGEFGEAAVVMDGLRASRHHFTEPIAQMTLGLAEATFNWAIGERETALSQACDGLALCQNDRGTHLRRLFPGAGTRFVARSGRRRASSILLA